MDITYRPYIRDSALKEVSFKSPVVNITGYTPKYTTDDIKEEPAQAVESQIEEIKAPKVNTSIPTISDKSINFKSKKEFKDTMTPLYESMLIKRGLNPAFAKALVAQDGLESSWGSKPAGNFNFGGIKGKGSVKKTREVIDGKDIYINDSFRDFNSLEDYVNYKIDLLNNNRYKAFSGDLSEFADRVHRGGYATDPNYSKVLNNIIASAKHGGVLKFQEGGLLEGKEWVKRWYLNRRPKIKQNIVQNQKIPVPVTGTFGYNVLAHNMRLTTAKVDPEKVPADASGVYYPWGRRIFLKEDSPSSAVHEWTHSSRPDPQVREIDKIKNVLGDTIYDQKSVIPDEYLDDSQEVYSRLMQLRHALGIDPDHEFTNEEIEALKKDHTKYQSLNSILRGNNKNKISTTIFDKDNNVIQAEPFSPEYKMSPEESTSHTEYDNDKTFNLLNRYSTDFLRRLLNDVAQGTSKKKESTLYAQSGMKIPKYQNAGAIEKSSEPWQVWDKRLNPNPIDTNLIAPVQYKDEPIIDDSVTVDFSGITTSSNRPYNSDYLNYINNFLVKKGYNIKQRASLLGDIIEESGGDPMAKSKNDTYQGILQWGDGRYRIQYQDPYKELDSQLEYLHNSLSNITDRVSWTHGGEGSNFKSGKQAYDAFHNSDIPIDSIHRAQSFGYVRPKGKEQSYLNRQQVVNQVLDRLNK